MNSNYMEKGEGQQEFFMKQALKVGEKGRYSSRPNPWVGCLIVKEGQIISEGYSSVAGGPHAEVRALERAGERARGATAFVTLEPCAHFGRTPPCTEALIKAGIARVIIPMEDPDPRVAGKGIAALRQARIEVEVGVLRKEAEEQLAPYLFQRKYKKPYTILKVASSLDGKIAAEDGSSRWITGVAARKDAHLLRAASCAIAVGATTARIDKPSLTVREVEEFFLPPKRLLFDRSALSPIEGYDMVFTSNSHHRYRGEGVYVVEKEHFFPEVLRILGEQNILQLLVEGGGKIHAALLPFANQLTLYFGNCLLGAKGISSFSQFHASSLKEAKRYKLTSVLRLGEDIRADYLSLS